MAKYDPLYEWLMLKSDTDEEEVLITFSEIEEILGVPLPISARMYRTYRLWWANDETNVQAAGGWIAAKWKVDRVDLGSEQVVFKRMVFNDPVFISEAIQQLKRKSVIICPDTCVLLQMVCMSSGLSSIGQFDKWLRQMNQCKALLNRDDIDWVIPEQVTREFHKNKEDKSKEDKNRKNKNIKGEFSSIKSFREKLISTADISNDELEVVNNTLIVAVSELEELAKQNQKRIIAKSLVLKEREGRYRRRYRRGNFIHDAWFLVHHDKFPNQKEQQMKDSTILSHLLAFSRETNYENFVPTIDMGIREIESDRIILSKYPIYFWTFDKFNKSDGSLASRFPEDASREFIEIISDIDSISYPQTIVP